MSVSQFVDFQQIRREATIHGRRLNGRALLKMLSGAREPRV